MKQIARSLYSQGLSARQIANLLNIGNATAYRWCKDIIRSKSEAKMGDKNPTYKGGYISKSGYRIISRNGKHFREHRTVVDAPRHLDVHHIDGDKLNNNPENLQLLSRSEHIKLHHKQGLYKNFRFIRKHTTEEIEYLRKIVKSRQRDKKGRFLLSNSG